MNWHTEIKKSPFFYSAKPVNDLSLLYPPFRVKMELLLKDARPRLTAAVFETYRSAERQADLYAMGRTRLKRNGMHHYGVACDIVFVDRSGAFVWREPYRGAWESLGAIGKRLGLYWGGDWKFRDCPHFQLVPATREAQEKIVKGVYP